MTPETSLKMLEVASATPSIRPIALGPAIKTDAKYKGIKGYSISLAESFTKLMSPMSQTVLGSERKVFHIFLNVALNVNAKKTGDYCHKHLKLNRIKRRIKESAVYMQRYNNSI
jgi:hypothetical protein